MGKLESLGILRLDGLHYYVHDLARSRLFYTERMDFAETAVSSPELERAGRQRSAVFEAGEIRVLCSEPAGEGGRAWRWLRKHPDGVGALVFQVEDIHKAFRLLEERGGTPITEVETVEDEGGKLHTFNITTPFGDTTFRFVQREGYRSIYPYMDLLPEPRGGKNEVGFGIVDHVTSNFETMKPALLWMEHVLGFEEYWEVKFHTAEAASAERKKVLMHGGSGLRSIVMIDPKSGLKFANNEPWRPDFKSSQINIFHEDQRGDGLQHAALTVANIVEGVTKMRGRGVEFMPTPGTYYDLLPERLRSIGVGAIEEDLGRLRDLGILVDGAAPGRYMLQIFLKDSAGLYHEPQAGPFFYEIIERKGDQGFGAGNFRALFESIEHDQQRSGRA
ncbi:MAG TPA: VOC family protein [Anaeromyxobacteraceae bacterium]|nr:VOC family protein [Anaeromyxobacteraceae bacterium]